MEFRTFLKTVSGHPFDGKPFFGNSWLFDLNPNLFSDLLYVAPNPQRYSTSKFARGFTHPAEFEHRVNDAIN